MDLLIFQEFTILFFVSPILTHQRDKQKASSAQQSFVSRPSHGRDCFLPNSSGRPKNPKSSSGVMILGQFMHSVVVNVVHNPEHESISAWFSLHIAIDSEVSAMLLSWAPRKRYSTQVPRQGRRPVLHYTILLVKSTSAIHASSALAIQSVSWKQYTQCMS